jgi:hypothetical protein
VLEGSSLAFALALMMVGSLDGLLALGSSLLVAASLVANLRGFRPWGLALAIAGAAGLGAAPWAHDLRHGWNGMMLAAALVVACAAWLLSRGLSGVLNPRWTMVAGFCAVLALQLFAGHLGQIPERITGFPSDQQLEGMNPLSPEWLDVQRWARDTTPEDALFLTPPDLQGFELGALRRTWVSDKEGAAVMWQPSFYDQWFPREQDVRGLKSFAELSTYACQHGISFIVIDRRPKPTLPSSDSFSPLYSQGVLPLAGPTVTPVYRNAVFDVVDARQCPVAR